jgi:hypothetical protein
MKRYLIVQLAIILVPILSYTQDLVIKGTKPVTKQYTPQEVLDSLQKTFPNAQSVKYYKTDAATAQKGWAVTTEDELDHSGEVEYYTISFKQEGLQYYGLYDPHGNLVEYKFEQKMDNLPEKVATSLKALSNDYPGYKVVDKTYFMTKNNSKSKEYYQVTASNGKDKKQVYYSQDGDFIKME